MCLSLYIVLAFYFLLVFVKEAFVEFLSKRIGVGIPLIAILKRI